MPLYGRGLQLDNPAKNGFYASASNPIPAGPYVNFQTILELKHSQTFKNKVDFHS